MSTEKTSGGLRAYGAHREAAGLPGHTHGAVQRAIRSGRLTGASVREVDGRVEIDFAAADVEWAARTDPTRQQRAERTEEAEAATLRRLHFRAKTLEEKFRDRTAQLVDAGAWAQSVVETIRELREAIGAIPALWCSRCPGLSADALAVAGAVIRDALEPLTALETRWPETASAELGPTPSAATTNEPPPSVADATTCEKGWLAVLQELEYYALIRALLPVVDVETPVEEACSNVRMALLGMPSKVKQLVPDLELPDLATLDEIIRETLTTLSEEARAA